MKYSSLILCTIFLMLTGCSNYIKQYEKVDFTEKTIKVPYGSWYSLGQIKEQLRKNNWNIYVTKGFQLEGVEGTQISFEDKNKEKTRYELILKESRSDFYLFNLEDQVRYDISLIDTKNSKEVLLMHGYDDPVEVANDFIKAVYSR